MYQSTDWEAKRAVDGSRYWYSPGLNKYSWAVPEELKTQADRNREAGEWYWLEHPEHGYVPAKKNPGSGYKIASGETVYVKKGAEKPRRLNWLNLTNSENDLVMLENVNPAVILFHVKQRYHTNQIYSFVGPILISCNPYKLLPLYTPAILNDYIKRDNRYLEPHVYSVANTAYRDLVSHSLSQSIVISGESGAGKTECTKQALQFLAEIAESNENIEQMILMANPVLEAFGNAKTVRNNNSSRFGKYLEVFFNQRNNIAGAKTTNYLLEKSRVCFQAKGERNYHVFYQLVAGASAQQKKWFRIKEMQSYHYLNQSGCDKVAGVPDGRLFNEELLPSMRQLDFKEDEINSIFRITSGVLKIGNISFNTIGERKCKVVAQEEVRDAASLLEVNAKDLNEVVTKTKLKVIGQAPISVGLSAQQATSARDALAKFVYEKMFDWLVKKVNAVVEPSGATRYSIGILDIFGFEIFEANSYEQLCINFTNEKLQQFFNFHTFKQEEKCYREEGIKYKKVPYIDNQPVLDLIEKKPSGILPMIDEELIVPKGTDLTLIKKMHSKHGNDANYREERKKRVDLFTVLHYAGEVTYDSRGFLEKDRDRLNDEAYALLSKSTCKFLSAMFPAKKKRKSAKQSTLGYRFSKQLGTLMKALHATEPHYIRCIKPNPNKAPLQFCGKMSFDQLRNSGVFEAVKIRKAGYPFRYTHTEFFWRFSCTMPENRGKWGRDMIGNCTTLIKNFGLDTKVVQIGRSKVLYRAPQHRLMESKRQIAVERVVRFLQRVSRGFIARCLFKRMKKIIPVLEHALKVRSTDALKAALAQADTVGFEMKLIKDARWQLHVFEEEERVEKLLQTLVHENPEECFGELAATLKTCEEIKYSSPIVEQARKIFVVARKVRDEIDEEGEKALASLEVHQLKNTLDKANALKFPHRSPTINKIIELLYNTAKDEFVKLQLKASLKQGDKARFIATTIKLRELSLNRTKELFRFSRFNLLYDSEAWAGKKLFCFDKKALAQSYRRHTSQPIHHSLIKLWDDKKNKKTALVLFKNILGYMGDRRYQQGQEVLLAQEILSMCVDVNDLRIEVYCQLMKQLTRNPRPESINKGWDLMMLCVSTFPPPPVIENFVELFIRENAPKKRVDPMINNMHHKMYDLKESGSTPTTPSANKMNDILDGRLKRGSICHGYNTSIAEFDQIKKTGQQEVTNAINLGANGLPTAPDQKQTKTGGGGGGAKSMKSRQQERPVREVIPQRPPRPANPPPNAGLPPNWKTATDPESGDIYYYNTITKETSWDKPTS
eukprot:jgi/Bigna1/140911/aug1.59_g15619